MKLWTGRDRDDHGEAAAAVIFSGLLLRPAHFNRLDRHYSQFAHRGTPCLPPYQMDRGLFWSHRSPFLLTQALIVFTDLWCRRERSQQHCSSREQESYMPSWQYSHQHLLRSQSPPIMLIWLAIQLRGQRVLAAPSSLWTLCLERVNKPAGTVCQRACPLPKNCTCTFPLTPSLSPLPPF